MIESHIFYGSMGNNIFKVSNSVGSWNNFIKKLGKFSITNSWTSKSINPIRLELFLR